MEPFTTGTVTVARLIAEATENRGAMAIVGGGGIVAAVNKWGYGGKVSHVSTGGGTSLELLEGKELPGVTTLPEA